MHNYIMERIFEKPEISAPAVTPSGHIALPQTAETPAIAPPGYALWPLAAVCATGAQPLSTNRLLWERHKQVRYLSRSLYPAHSDSSTVPRLSSVVSM